LAISRLLQKLSFKSQEGAAMAEAYEGGLIDFGIEDRSDPRTENLAVAVLALFRAGETDPVHLKVRAVRLSDAGM
jgi:hypothetical protein